MAPHDHPARTGTIQAQSKDHDERRGLSISRGSVVLWRGFLVRLVAVFLLIDLLGTVFFKQTMGALLITAVPVVLFWVALRAWFPSAHSELQLVVTESLEEGGNSAVIDLGPGARFVLAIRLWWGLVWPLASGCLVLGVVLVTFMKDSSIASVLPLSAIVFGSYASIALALRKRLKDNKEQCVARPAQGLPSTGTQPVVFLLREVRQFRAAKRKFFRGPAPAWATDLYALLKYVNLLELAPTLVAVAFAPIHFFSKLDRSGKPLLTVYKTPMKFLMTAASTLAMAIGWIIAVFLHRKVDGSSMEYVLIGFALAVPAWAIVLSGFVFVCYKGGLVPWWFKRVNSRWTQLDYSAITKIVSWSSYRELDWLRFFWSLLYFGVYLYAVSIVILVAGFLVSPLLAAQFRSNSLVFFIWMNIVFLVPAQRFILHPYAELLRSSRQRYESAQPVQAERATPPNKHVISEWCIGILIALFGVTMIMHAFKISGGAMEPSLLVGDFVLVNRLSYGPSENVGQKLLPYRVPMRDDVVAFRYPIDIRETFVSRIVAGPGDRVHIINKQTFLNGHALNEPYVVHELDYIDSYRDNFPSEPNTPLYPPAMEMLEHHMQSGDVVVPPGNYFVMGDNRDQSLDSRYFGFLPRENIIGEPLLIYWSYDAPDELYALGTEPSQLFGSVKQMFSRTRWSRIFRRVFL